MATGPIDRFGIKVGNQQVSAPGSFVPSADLAIKTPVLCATTAAIVLSGLQTIDGVAVVEGSRVLVKDQADTTTNGIYNASSGVWSRSPDQIGNDDFVASQIIFVHSGTTNASTLYQLVATDPVILNTSPISYGRVSFPALGNLFGTSPVLINGGASAPFNVNPTVSILANGITYALLQQVAAASLVGNPTAGLATAQGITLGATLAFSGSALQTAAHTGDVTTAANSFVTTLVTAQPGAHTWAATQTFNANVILQTADAKLVIGNATAPSNPWHGGSSNASVVGNSLNTGSLALSEYANVQAGAGPGVSITRIKNNTIGGQGASPAGTVIGVYAWAASDGTSLLQAAVVKAVIESTWGTNSGPTYLSFQTNNSGTTPTEWMRLSSAGLLTLSGSFSAPNMVTNASLAQMPASTLKGNATGGLANAADLTIGATLAFSGSALQTIAMSGDISTSANSFVTAIGANKVLNTMIRQGVARSVIGVTGNATANVADIQGTANQALVVNSAGTALAFGQVNLAAAAAVTGTLPSSLGGTDNAAYAVGDLLQASAVTPTLARLAAVATGNALISGGVGVVSAWGKIGLTTHISGTLAVGNGGTGATTFTAHGILLGETAGAIVATAAMTDGQLLVGQTGADPLPKTLSTDATLAASGALTISANVVTYAKLQQVAASSLVGNATGSLANATGITIGATLAFSGSALQTLALTGDVTAGANSFVTTVAKIQGTTVSGTTGSGNVVFSSGASLTSPAISGSPTITGLGAPSAASDAANKAYVDSTAQGLSAKPSAIVASTAALPTNIYANGSSGVGATITFVSTGVVAIDGRNLALNDVVLIKNEATGANNGLYVVTLAPAIGVAGILTRHTSMDTTGEFDGAFIFVETGTVNGAAGFVCTNSTPPTVGTTAITFTQFSGAGEITVTAELTKTGNQLSITTNGVTYALFQQVAASSLVGNATGSLANATGITLGATLAFSGSALQTAAITGDVTAAANSFATTLAANIVSNAKFRQGGALTVVGVTGNATANVADIAAVAASGAVLRESGSTIGFGTIATAGIAAAAVTYAKIQNVAASSLIGNATGSPAAATDISIGATLAFSGSALQTAAHTGDVTTAANSFVTTIAANAVTNAKMATMADKTIKSNISGGSAVPSDNTLSAIIDTIGSAQGSILYRNASIWTVLTPGTSGQFLQTQGASANVVWATGGGGGGSSVTDGWVEHGNFGGI